MKSWKTPWAVVSILSIALIVNTVVPSAQAGEFSEISAENNRYPYSTVWLAGIAIASGAVMASSSVASDKKQHFGISVVLGASSEHILRHFNYFPEHRWKRIAVATGMGLVPGVLKELSDSRFDSGDLLADVIGSFTGALVSDLLKGPVQPTLSVNLGKDNVRLAIYQSF
ncbi:hypothetical protein [Endozoicomonas sp. Mp262]|uniref:hypothetical protein n=1 Tax=Endozoicomonas sp. Mp262 TaxID=2919499 RepID=UPI0021DAA865